MSKCLCCQDLFESDKDSFHMIDERLDAYEIFICRECESILRARKREYEDKNILVFKNIIDDVICHKNSISRQIDFFREILLRGGAKTAFRYEIEEKEHFTKIYKTDIYIQKRIKELNKLYPLIASELAMIGLASTASRYFTFSSTEVMELFKIKQSAINRLRKEKSIKGYGHRYDRSEISKMLKY